MALTSSQFLMQTQQSSLKGATSFLNYTPSIRQDATPKKKKKKKNTGGLWGGIRYTLGKLGTGAFSVVEGIWDYTAGGIADLFGADEWAEEQFANNIAAGWNQDLDEWYNPSSGWKMAGDVASGVGNTLTGIAGAAAVTIFTGGAAAPYAGMIAAGTMGLGAAGNATSEAYAKTGKLGFKEYAYGALSGGTEMALEKVVGTGGRYASKIFGKQTAKTVAKKSLLKNIGKDFAGEFFEESISEFITPYYQRWTQVDPNAENATIQQIGYAGLVGGLSGGLMGGIGTGISTVQSINRGDKIAKNQAYANAVVEMSEKFAKYETENNTGKEAYRYVTELVNDFKARDNGTGNLTLGQKKILGQMERANVVLAFEPEIQRSKEKILANADAFAEYVNSRNIIDGTTGKPFHFENGEALTKNEGLVTQFAVADALGELLLSPDSVYDVVSKNRTGEVLQADYLNFQKNATSQQKAAVKEVFGVDVDSTTYDDFIAATQKVDKLTIDKIQGGMSARASSRKALSNAMATNAEVVAFDKNTKLSDGTSVYKTANGKLYAVTKIGEGYYLFNGKDISKKLSKEELVKAIDELNGVKTETKQEGEKTAKTTQKTKKESKAQTSSTETKTKQESETSKPKTTTKKKATGKKKTAAVKPATEKAKPTDKATQKREAIAKMRESEDTTERVLAELYDNGTADYDAVSEMKDGQDLSTVDKVAYFATGTVKDYARQGLYTKKSLAKAIKEYADDIRAGKDVLVQVMDMAIELDGKQQPNWYKEQYHKAAEPTTAKKKTPAKKTAPKAKETETTTAKPVKEKSIHGKTYKDFTVEEFNALSEPFRNYYLAKSKNPNAIVFVQLGDFYEAFFDDAKTAANEVELTLTGRAVNGYADRVEMVGFPIRFFDNYKAKLNAKGLDVVKVDLDGKKVLYAAKTSTESTTQYAILENATQETQLAGGKSQNLTPLQMKRAESFARTHVKGYENLTAAEKLEVEWTIASGWRYGASESDILSLAKISAQSGVGIGFADLKATTSDGKVVAPDAACYSRGGHLTIYLNPKSKRTVEVATLHELTHALKGAKGYAELEKMALEYYAKHPKEKAIIDNAYRALYQDEQLRYEKEVLPDELTAHYIEKMLEKRNVLSQLTAEQPTFMQRCINWLKTRVDKLRGVDTQAANEVDILARKFVSTYNLNKGKIANKAYLQQEKKYSLNKTFRERIDAWDGKTVGFSFVVGETSEVLKSIGVEDKQIRWDATKLQKIMRDHPEMTKEVIKNIPNVIENPILIMDAKKFDTRLVLLGDVYDANGKVVTVVLELAPRKITPNGATYLDLIKIASAQGRSNTQSLINGSNIRYIDKNKNRVTKWLNVNRLQLPLRSTNDNSTNSISENPENVNTFEKKFAISSKKYALSAVDSDGRALSAAQQEFFKDSKAVDGKGRLLPLYHGTNNTEFTVFDEAKIGASTRNEGIFGKGFYFTNNQNYAGYYNRKDNNLAKDGSGRVLDVYLNLKNPFMWNTIKTEQDVQALAESLGLPKGTITYNRTQSELHAITDNAKIRRFTDALKKAGYDGVIYTYPQSSDEKRHNRFTSEYVAFYPEQIKLTSNTNPTESPDIRYALSVDGETTPVDVEEGKNLVALHNLSEDKLLRVVELGGFPMPSIAVTTTELPHENYGDITVVFGRETIDPETDYRNVVYDRDAWTPTTPTVDVKLSNEAVDALIKELQDKVKGYSAYERNIFSFFDGKYRTNNGDYIVSDMDYTKESFGERAIRSSGIVAAYLSEKGVNVEPVYAERGFTMGWSSFTRKEATELFDFVGITKDITRDNATQEQRDAILEKFIEYRAKERLGLMRRFKKDKTLTIEQVKEILRGEYDDGHVSQLFFMAEDFFNEKRPKDIYDEYATLEKMQSEITDKQDFYDWFWNKVESTFEKKGIDNDSDVFDSRGNRRSFEQRHYSYTAANIVRAMQHGDQEGNIPLGMTAGALAAKLSKRFDSIEDIREAKEYLALVSEEDLKAFNDKTYELYDELVTTIAGRTSDFMSDSSRRDDVGDILGKCAAVKPLTIENIKRKFSSETRGYNLGYKFNDQIAEQALLLFESLKHIPTTYFEAKPRRVVGFGEIKTVLIPKTASDKLKTQLSKKKIKWQVYGEGDNSRSKIIKTMDNARFALPLKGSDKVMTKLPNDKVTLKDVISGKATKEELKAQAKANRSEKLEATKVLMTNAQAGVERVLTEGGTKNASAVTNYVRAGRAAAMNAIEKDGSQYNLDGTQRVGMSLGAIMMPIYEDYKNGESTYEDFELYLLHWHNIDRYEAGKPVFHEMGAPIEEHVTPDDSRKAIAELDKQYPDFKQRAEKVWKFNDNNLQMRLDGGLYTQEYVDVIREMYPHYVPTYREEYATKAAMLMGRNSVRVSNSKKKAQGSSSKILPIDDSMAAQTIQVTTTARLNKMLVTMAENGNTDDFQIIESEDAEMDVDKDTEVTFYANKDKNDYQVTFYHNGKQVTARCSWTVYKGIEAYRGSDDMNNNVAIAAVAKGNSLFKKLVTSWNPFFSFFKNPIRDMQDALINTRYSAVKFLKNYARARKEIKSNGKYWQEAKAAGISAASLYDQEKGIEYKQQESRIKEKGKKVMQSLEKASNSLEMTPRLAEYICAREAGFSPQDALLQAQDVTTNFGRGGTFAKKLNSTIMPFLNPSIQGFSKVWRAYFTAENGRKQWISLIIKSLILGVGITALNDLLNDDDEEYESLSDYVKEQNYVLGLGGGDFLKIPKGRVVSVFGSAFLRGKRYSQGDSEAWKGYFDTVTSAVTPVDNITRNIFSPITDVQTNTAWYGGAIESQKWDDTEPKNRYDESTSKISIWLGNLFNYSPIKIDYLLEQYTGIVGDLVLPATSTQAESGIVSQNLLANGITNSKWSTNFYSTIEKYTYKKTAGDLQAKGVVRYLNKIRGTVSDMYNDKRKIQASKSLSDSEKLKETKIMQAAINTLMQEAIGNAEYIYQEMGKYDLSTDELFDQAYLDCISVVMGAEYALKSYNKDVYEKATKLNTLGIDYGSYYDFYFGLKDITSDKTIDGKTVAGSKKANVINYVMSQNLSTAQKLVLIMAQGYTITDNDVKGLTAKKAKTMVAQYISSLSITKEEKTELAKMLGFTVKNGKIYFK